MMCATRSAMAADGVTITSDRRAARRTTGARRRVAARSDGSRLAHSLSVRKSRGLPSRVHFSPPGETKLTLLSATRRPRIGPATSRRKSHAGSMRRFTPMSLMSVALAALQVAVQLHPEAGAASDNSAGGVHEYGRAHVLSLVSCRSLESEQTQRRMLG